MATNPYYDPNQRVSKGYPQLHDVHQGQPVANQNQVVQGQPIYQGQPPAMYQQYPPVYQPATVITLNAPPMYQGAVVFPNCAICRQKTGTTVMQKYGGLVWIMALVFCFFTGCLCFIPFLIDQWKDKQHHCTTCGNVKGIQPGRLC